MYRITIEKLKNLEEPGQKYEEWKELYQQQVDDLDVQELVTIINGRRELKLTKQQ